MNKKPKLFIGSSSESKVIAYAVQQELEDDAEITVWSQGIFKLSNNYLEDLIKSLELFDFAILVYSPDDKATIRNRDLTIPRDNVVFETGLFMGRLGKERVYFLRPKNVSDFHILSDLSGISFGTYDSERSDKNFRSAVGPFCNEVRERINSIKNDFNDRPLHNLITNKLEIVGRALSAPKLPGVTKIRLFLFKKVENKLVCSNFWAINPVKEPEGNVTFEISEEWKDKLIVVKSILNKEIVSQEIINEEQKKLSLLKTVAEDISYVVSSPIFNVDGSIWGAIAVDTLSNIGKKQLKGEISESTLFKLSKYLQLLISINSKIKNIT